MKIFVGKDKKSGDKEAFRIIKKQIQKNPASLIGLAVGKTTDGLYKLINKSAIKHPAFWRNVKLFQIDENLGFGPDSHLSFNYEIKRELNPLFKILNKKNIFLIDGRKKPKTTIQEAHRFIKRNKGIDLIILGLGPEYDPHIAYNTSGKSSLNSKMRVVELHPLISKKLATKAGITLGIKDILDTKKALLLAYGKDKAKSLKLALKKVNMKKASASALLLHNDLTIVIDNEAAMLM